MPALLDVSPILARQFHRRAVLLDAPVPDVGAALLHHGYIQIDPINICGRIHDHILRNRVFGYREGGLMRHVHGEEEALPAQARVAFEHHLPDSNVLAAFPLSAWPYLLGAMEARTRRHSAWSGRLTPAEKRLAERILGEIAERGPLSSDRIGDRRPSRRNVWGRATLVKSVLQRLFFHGRVLIARRENNRRVYDLPERVIPAATLAAPVPGPQEAARWAIAARLRQRRLVQLKRAELPLVEDLVQPLRVDGCPRLYCLRQDVPLLEQVAAADPGREKGVSAPVLLAPLDPLIYDRRITLDLWGFDYTWEVYTPPDKRIRGYYALPILVGTELVGHVDPKADRKARSIRIVSSRVRRGHRIAPAVKALGTFLGLGV